MPLVERLCFVVNIRQLMPALIATTPCKLPEHGQGHTFFDYKNIPPRQAQLINAGKLANEGITEYNNLTGFKTDGIEVVEHTVVPESTLKLQRNLKIGANIGAVALNAVSAVGLLYSGAKLFMSSFGMGDVEESYKSMGNAYSASAVAGALTGAAHESGEWSIGNIGMGIFSRYLDKIWGLAGFSISEGLAAVGMGRVRYRDKKNVYAVKNSLFNHPKLSNLRFLMPVEQSIINFAKRFISLEGWKRFKTEEPYSLFQTAGGGLVSAGGLLGIASMFKEKMSEKLQSFFYLPYSAFSIMNLIAFYRDGEKVLDRAKDIGSRKKGELYSMRVEGNFKKLSSPILALNNLFLGLKGLGIDSSGGIMYNLAMAARAWGAAFAFLGFKAQSMIKFFNPDMFGPKLKEIFKIKLNPIKESVSLFRHLQTLTDNKPPFHMSDKFLSILYDGDNEEREVIDKIIQTETFQSMKNKTQIGLPNSNQPGEGGRYYLERFNHSIRVGAIVILIYNALLKNTHDAELRNFLLENKEAFRLSGLLHDIGHIARSHLAEQAVRGHNNDEHTLAILKDLNSDISQEVIKYYGREKGETVLKQAREIIGKWSPLFKAFKIGDYTEYLRCGDFSSTEGFPKWDIDQVKDYVDHVRLFKDKDGTVRTGFTEKGAIISFINLFDRKVYNDSYNTHPIQQVAETPYLLGLDAADLSSDYVKQITEAQMDKAAREGLEKVKGSRFQFRIKNMTGGDTAYCGYSQVDPERKIYVVFDDGKGKEPMEFIDYAKQLLKPNDKDVYDDLLPRMNGLTTPKEIDITLDVDAV